MKVVIIGGVAAGMSTAARLRRLDESAQIVVFEKSQYVSFANCGLPYYIGNQIPEREQLLLQTPATLAETLNIDVRAAQQVLEISPNQKIVKVCKLENGEIYEEGYDKLVLCPGAKPIKPKLDGVDNDNILTLRNIEDMDRIKAKLNSSAKIVCVIGGGYIGVEMAENLAHLGLQVTLIERNSKIIATLDAEMSKDLQDELEAHGVEVKLNHEVQGFTKHGDDSVEVQLQGGQKLHVDRVILAIGVRPDVELLRGTEIQLGPNGGILVNQHMQTSVADIYAAGDAVEVVDAVTQQPALIPLAGPANRQGRVVADNLVGISSRYVSTQATSIIKVFGMTGAGTGASEKHLRAASIPYQKIYLHPYGHATYYPGSKPMHMKVLFSPTDGKLLGAQVVGYDGVDKRIDVLATAIKAGMSVYDLEDLELAYAPPYGSAKDAINMAGFIAANLLQGRVKFYYAEQLAELNQQAILIDVRGEVEYQAGHIPQAINIPLKQLRQRIQHLPKDKIILLNCMVGMRSYFAQRILMQNGFTDVRTLAGGYKTYLNTLPL